MKLQYDELLSNFAFKSNLRRYTGVGWRDGYGERLARRGRGAGAGEGDVVWQAPAGMMGVTATAITAGYTRGHQAAGAGPHTPPEVDSERPGAKKRRTSGMGTSTGAGAVGVSETAVEDVALWAAVDAVAGTERETHEVATGFAAAAVNVLRNLSFVAANRGDLAGGAAGLVPILQRCIASTGGGGGGGGGGRSGVGGSTSDEAADDAAPLRMAADAADVIRNLAEGNNRFLASPELAATMCGRA